MYVFIKCLHVFRTTFYGGGIERKKNQITFLDLNVDNQLIITYLYI